MSKRMLALFLCVCMVMSNVSVTVAANDQEMDSSQQENACETEYSEISEEPSDQQEEIEEKTEELLTQQEEKEKQPEEDTTEVQLQKYNLTTKVKVSHILENESVTAINVESVGTQTDNGNISSIADSFSTPFNIDFHYDDLTYGISGYDKSEILLSELFQKLDIKEEVNEVTGVEFTGGSLIQIEQLESDWRLTFSEGFATDERLTITFLNGESICIQVTGIRYQVTVFKNKNVADTGGVAAHVAMPGESWTFAIEANKGYFIDYIEDKYKYKDKDNIIETVNIDKERYEYTVDNVTCNRDVTVYLNPIRYTITYELNGGEIASGLENPETYTVEDSFSLINPTREGYEFVGWICLEKTVNEETGEISWEISDENPQENVFIWKSTGDKKYTAVYSKSYTVRHCLLYSDSDADKSDDKAFLGEVITERVETEEEVQLGIQDIEIQNIDGFSYTGNSYDDNGTTCSLEPNGEGTILLGGGKTIENGGVINLYYSPVQTTVTVNMHVEGKYADKTKEFTGTVAVTYYEVDNNFKENGETVSSYNPVNSDSNDTSYKYSLTGGDLEELTLNAGEKITIEWTEPDSSYYSLSYVTCTIDGTDYTFKNSTNATDVVAYAIENTENEENEENTEPVTLSENNATISLSGDGSEVTIDVCYVRENPAAPLTGLEGGNRSASWALITVAMLGIGTYPFVCSKNRRRRK